MRALISIFFCCAALLGGVLLPYMANAHGVGDQLCGASTSTNARCAEPTECIEDTDGHWVCRNPSVGGTVAVRPFDPPTNTQSFSGFICNVTNLISQQLLPPLAVLAALVVGFLFLVSGGDPGKANAAKKALFFTLIGVALLVLAPGIVSLLSDLFGGFQITPLACQGSVAAGAIVNALVRLVNWFSWFVAITSVVMGLYAGYLYMTAGGNAQRVVQASRVLSFTIIGIAVAVVAFSIIAIVRTFLG